MKRTWISLLLFVAAVSLANGCSTDSGEGLSERRSAVIAGSVFTDGVGYTFVDPGCSGTLLSPQWVLSAGHCFQDGLSPFPVSHTSTTVYLGTSTTDGRASSDIYIHPKWWHSGETPPTQPTENFWNSGYDVALIRLPNTFGANGQYLPGRFYNQLSNRWIGVGDSLLCAGYGGTSAPFRGGGIGVLRNALLPVTSIGHLQDSIALWSSNDMIHVSPNSSGQIVYAGDSGGSCYTQAPFSDPYVISGIISNLTYGNGGSAAPTKGHLVYPWDVQEWVDSIMHSGPQGLSVNSGIPSNAAFNIATVGSSCPPCEFLPGPMSFIYASNTAGAIAVNENYSPAGFIALPTTGLPTGGSGVSSTIGVAADNSGTYPKVTIARISVDGQLYFARTGPWYNLVDGSWSSAGVPSGLTFTKDPPAVAILLPNRYDFFARGTDSQIWTRWGTMSGSTMTWQSSWTQISSSTAFQGGVSVARGWSNRYLVVAMSTDGTPWTAEMEGITASYYGNGWSGWSSIGGGFFSNVVAVGWNRGYDIYGIGQDNALWHNSVDNDHLYSGWLSLGGSYSATFPDGIGGNNAGVNWSWPAEGARMINLVVPGGDGLPKEVGYPR